MKRVTIIGAGLVGSLQAIFMAKRGYQVDVYERRPDLRKAEIGAGRSINLVVSKRGWTALEAAGIAEQIREIVVPVYGRMAHDKESNQSFHPYSIDNKAISSVSRGELNCRLMDCAEEFENVTLHFNQRCTDVDLDSSIAYFEDRDGNKSTVQSDLLIGTDGAYSAVRNRMLKTDRFNYQQYYIEHGYKELVIPPNEDGTPRLRMDALHIWPRKQFMLMALANLDGGFTCTLFLPFEGERSFEGIKNDGDLLGFFQEEFPDAIPLMPTLKEDWEANPTSSLVIVKCSPWVYGSTAMLMGDAAHAIVPFYGEGMNCGFEDCYVFNEILNHYGDDDMSKVLQCYHEARKENGDAIADLSLRNFIEMRDLFADPNFILRKKIEGKVYKTHPDKWIPLYSQVKFTDIPYSEAKREGERHDAIMQAVMQQPNVAENWDYEEVVEAVLQHLQSN